MLQRAQAGDAGAFRDLVQPHREELRLHCYRLLGSVTDAEDAVQEVLLAAWRGVAGFEGRASVRTWLYRIATNRCLNVLRDNGRRRPPEPVPPFVPPEPTRRGDVTWLQPYPESVVDPAPGPEARYDGREAVELAFITGLQLLPPRQAATLVLRDVLGYPAAEVASMLGTTETAVKGALQRARATLDRHRAGSDSADRRPAPGSAEEQALTRKFADAFTAGDVAGVVALLSDEAWLAMPPAPHEYHGPAIAEFLRVSFGWRGARTVHLVPTRANTQPAFACYHGEPGAVTAHRAGLVVLTLVEDGIGRVTRFHDDAVFDHFGLPDQMSCA
ncbi:RNA polymerase subunit sigma-70 [Saccharothrix variisporea]|uniref:RNA polymerase subunit sigma-70 n=1 Tax=Saccharothrix variisporea TaxID=543527 RepID=UPI000EB24E1F|nr:RNA polymerase subunit sigma-70 [Saccharothrix variisporea]